MEMYRVEQWKISLNGKPVKIFGRHEVFEVTNGDIYIYKALTDEAVSLLSSLGNHCIKFKATYGELTVRGSGLLTIVPELKISSEINMLTIKIENAKPKVTIESDKQNKLANGGVVTGSRYKM